MHIKFMGAAGTVTGSSYVITSGSGKSILIDLGMFQGTEKEDALNYTPYEYDVPNLIGAVLTHAHLDHCGRLPILEKMNFKGNIRMTSATADLTQLSLLDSAKIAEGNDIPLYTTDLAKRIINRFTTFEYHTPFQIGDFEITFFDAGHILGSASLVVEDKSAVSDIRKIVFSGDLGNTPEDLVCATELIDSADAVIMESTYGDKLHPTDDASKQLQVEFNTIEEKGGTLLIPAFSLDRTQEILHLISHLKKDGKVKTQTPVYLDAPMGQKATAIYLDYPTLFNEHIKQEMHGEEPFDFPGLRVVKVHEESERLDTNPDTKVIIAGSGMMTGGRIVGHAAHYLSDPTTRLFIVGYQGEGTLGRELLERTKEVTIEGTKVPVNATVSNTQSMSSHADQKQLMDWLVAIKGVKKLFLTHGEDGPRKVLAEKIKTDLGIEDITMPHLHDEVEL